MPSSGRNHNTQPQLVPLSISIVPRPATTCVTSSKTLASTRSMNTSLQQTCLYWKDPAQVTKSISIHQKRSIMVSSWFQILSTAAMIGDWLLKRVELEQGTSHRFVKGLAALDLLEMYLLLFTLQQNEAPGEHNGKYRRDRQLRGFNRQNPLSSVQQAPEAPTWPTNNQPFPGFRPAPLMSLQTTAPAATPHRQYFTANYTGNIPPSEASTGQQFRNQVNPWTRRQQVNQRGYFSTGYQSVPNK